MKTVTPSLSGSIDLAQLRMHSYPFRIPTANSLGEALEFSKTMALKRERSAFQGQA